MNPAIYELLEKSPLVATVVIFGLILKSCRPLIVAASVRVLDKTGNARVRLRLVSGLQTLYRTDKIKDCTKKSKKAAPGGKADGTSK